MTNRLLLIALVLCLAACATSPPSVVEPTPVSAPAAVADEPLARPCLPHDEAPLRAMLAFYASNARNPGVPARERIAGGDPYLMMRLAIQWGQARPPDLARAQAQLEAVIKSPHPAAVNLVPLARLLHDQFGERQRADLQLREAQRRADLLQDKIDALTAIERSLPSLAPASGLPASPAKPTENMR